MDYLLNFSLGVNLLTLIVLVVFSDLRPLCLVTSNWIGHLHRTVRYNQNVSVNPNENYMYLVTLNLEAYHCCHLVAVLC